MLTCYYFWNLLKWIQGFNSCFFLLFNFQGPFVCCLMWQLCYYIKSFSFCQHFFQKNFKIFQYFFEVSKNRITKPFFARLSSENCGLHSKHCKHYRKKRNKKEHADICLDLFFDMLLSCCLFFLGKRFFSLCHWNTLLFNIVLIIYYIFLKKASIVFQTNFPAPKSLRINLFAQKRFCQPSFIFRYYLFPWPFYILFNSFFINRLGQSVTACCFCWGP